MQIIANSIYLIKRAMLENYLGKGQDGVIYCLKFIIRNWRNSVEKESFIGV